MAAPHFAVVAIPQAPTIVQQSQLGGAQATLALAAMHVTRHSTKALETGATWDRHMLATALRDTRAALAEIEALFAASVAEVAE